ncbi:MAG: arginine--tRNA ligase [Chitinophagaceae bacterium]|nr:MAG: arginine--tRNA ligase [Chitinophagaceae bacterium]
MSLVQQIRQAGIEAVKALYNQDIQPDQLTVNETKPEFDGDYTIVMFSLTKFTRQKPEESGKTVGDWLTGHHPDIFKKYNVVKGFLNLSISDPYYVSFLQSSLTKNTVPQVNGKKVMVEFASPNTNKPLHLGHLRNIFLGAAISNILEANGYEVIKANLVNDRGIHICKSMVAWLHYGNDVTPESSGIKGDHLVGDYYVKFNDVYKKQMEELIHSGKSKEEAEKEASILKEAQEMLLKWEQDDQETRKLWAKMNGWVYKGFEETYRRMGVSFDKMYYESETYLLGKEIVEEGLKKDIFFKKPDGSVWIDLTKEGLDEKLLLRADGTSVYMTQDLGTAQLKYDDYHIDQSIYVIGDEQNYHMKVLKLILQKLGKPYADGIEHLSYGMVELPGGRMKSREGTVVDADDLMDEMIQTAAKHTEELGKVKDFSGEELEKLYEVLGMGATKFYLLRVNPKRKMVFNPEESIDFHGFTGPFVQYTYARIRSILRKEEIQTNRPISHALLPLEKAIIIQSEKYEQALSAACIEMDPSIIANYAFETAQIFNSFYTEYSVINAESDEKKSLRLQLCHATAMAISDSMGLLGITAPERM